MLIIFRWKQKSGINFIIYGNFYFQHGFNYACDECYSKVTAEFTIFIIIITQFFYNLAFFFMKMHDKQNQEKMIDLDSLVKLQGDEIKKLNVDLIFLKATNENLGRKRSVCSIDSENQYDLPLAESETYILTRLTLRKTNSNGSAQSLQFDNDSTSGGDVEEFVWSSNDWKFQTGKLRGSLLTFMFKKEAKYMDGVKFHRILLFCSKHYNRKITEILLSFTPSPGISYIIFIFIYVYLNNFDKRFGFEIPRKHMF